MACLEMRDMVTFGFEVYKTENNVVSEGFARASDGAGLENIYTTTHGAGCVLLMYQAIDITH